MTILLLVRHGQTTANASGILAGRTPGMLLDETGHDQVKAAGQRLAHLPLHALVTSPMERCRQTAEALAAGLAETAPTPPVPDIEVDEEFAEVDYGAWSGRELASLADEELWRTVQAHPSAARFPEGEAMAAMSHRAVGAVRRHDAALAAQHGPHAVWAVVSHGDIIKAILADALGMHLDQFQRLVVNPASISVVRYTDTRPYVLAMNTTHGAVSAMVPPPPPPKGDPGPDDAPVGGGLGAGT